MRRRASLVVALAAACGLLAVGCGGGSKKDDYKHSYNTLNDQLVKLENRVGTAAVNASGISNRQLGQEFSVFADEMDQIHQKLRGLDPPGDLRAAHAALVRSTGNVQNDLQNVGRAANGNDQQGAGTAFSNLLVDTAKLRAVQRRIDHATGAKA